MSDFCKFCIFLALCGYVALANNQVCQVETGQKCVSDSLSRLLKHDSAADSFHQLKASHHPLSFKQMINSIREDQNCTSTCCQDLLSLRDNPLKKPQLLQFYDASSTYRSPSRFAGYLNSEGTYNLCKRSGGNYCRISKNSEGFDLHYFHCVPESCSVHDMNQVIASFGEIMPINIV